MCKKIRKQKYKQKHENNKKYKETAFKTMKTATNKNETKIIKQKMQKRLTMNSSKKHTKIIKSNIRKQNNKNTIKTKISNRTGKTTTKRNNIYIYIYIYI